MFEQAFKNIDDILRKDAGVGSELDFAVACRNKQIDMLITVKF